MDELVGIEFRHLRTSPEDAENGTVTEAARRLRITQPSLSQQIRSLDAVSARRCSTATHVVPVPGCQSR